MNLNCEKLKLIAVRTTAPMIPGYFMMPAHPLQTLVIVMTESPFKAEVTFCGFERKMVNQ